jgi:hypothetical protein
LNLHLAEKKSQAAEQPQKLEVFRRRLAEEKKLDPSQRDRPRL